jgi:hypothetical protein
MDGLHLIGDESKPLDLSRPEGRLITLQVLNKSQLCIGYFAAFRLICKHNSLCRLSRNKAFSVAASEGCSQSIGGSAIKHAID